MVKATRNGEDWRDLIRHWFRFSAWARCTVSSSSFWPLWLTASVYTILGRRWSPSRRPSCNLIWHERWTWAERNPPPWPGDILLRLVRFNTVTGLTSILGNLVLMRVFVGALGLHYGGHRPSPGYALNFAASEWFVFKIGKTNASRTPTDAPLTRPGGGQPSLTVRSIGLFFGVRLLRVRCLRAAPNCSARRATPAGIPFSRASRRSSANSCLASSSSRRAASRPAGRPSRSRRTAMVSGRSRRPARRCPALQQVDIERQRRLIGGLCPDAIRFRLFAGRLSILDRLKLVHETL